MRLWSKFRSLINVSIDFQAFSDNKNAYTFAPLTLGFAELSADLAEVAIAHCQLIVVSK